MTVPNVPPNKFTSVLWSASAQKQLDGSWTLLSDAVNVASVSTAPEGGPVFQLTQPVPVSLARRFQVSTICTAVGGDELWNPGEKRLALLSPDGKLVTGVSQYSVPEAYPLIVTTAAVDTGAR